jgi:hypothetical protein
MNVFLPTCFIHERLEHCLRTVRSFLPLGGPVRYRSGLPALWSYLACRLPIDFYCEDTLCSVLLLELSFRCEKPTPLFLLRTRKNTWSPLWTWLPKHLHCIKPRCKLALKFYYMKESTRYSIGMRFKSRSIRPLQDQERGPSLQDHRWEVLVTVPMTLAWYWMK